ncbi:MAG: hypothetical protein U9P14_05625, partial [Gemmatimonadota bacterium]|nr:hypothetical protein [Gemmatimonadota bacterium]
RPSLKIFSEKYQSYFACRAPATEEPAGRLVPVDPGGAEPAAVRLMQRMDVGLAKIGWNFQRYGQWIPPQAIRFSDFTWACQADPRKYPEISVREVRSLAEALSTAGIQPVLGAAFSLRCDRSLAEDIFFADIARDELGAPIESGDGAVLMHSSPTSPFGRHILEQQRLMIDTYPEAAGFYFEDLSRAAVDFAHDDNLTMVHNRPACNLGNIFRTLGPKLARMVHDAGKLVLARPATTISASRGIDIFCFEGEDLDRNIGALALMCLDRPVVSLPARDETPDPVELELEMQRQILWGVLPSTSLMQASPELARAYRLLHQSLKGRKWILEPHALGQFPKGVRGNLFRVPSSDRPDRTDLLVTVVRPGVRLADQSSGRGVSVRVRLPGAERLTRALWTAAARPAWPVPLNAVYDNEAGELKVELPPFGPAGVLRLARR